jgi:hypothetical protein
MKPMNRFALTLLGSLICLSVAQEQCRATFDIFGAVDGQGADPLVDSYPFFIFPGKSRSALIIFQSDAYEGVVTLEVSCCTNMTGGAVAPAGLNVEAVADDSWLNRHFVPGLRPPGTPPSSVTLGRNQFFTRAHEVRKVGLLVTADPDPNVMIGRFTAKVDAVKSDGSSASTQVIINVLPTMTNTPTPPCAAFTDATGGSSVPSGPASPGATLIPSDPTANLVNLFDLKRTNPTKTAWEIGDVLGSSTGSEGQYMVLSKSLMPPLTPTTAKFGFYNSTSGQRQYVLFNTLTCTPAAPPVQLNSGDRATVIANATTTKTILFRMTNDGKSWKNISIFSAGPFWTVFGGKEVEFQWIEGADRTVYGCFLC